MFSVIIPPFDRRLRTPLIPVCREGANASFSFLTLAANPHPTSSRLHQDFIQTSSRHQHQDTARGSKPSARIFARAVNRGAGKSCRCHVSLRAGRTSSRRLQLASSGRVPLVSTRPTPSPRTCPASTHDAINPGRGGKPPGRAHRLHVLDLVPHRVSDHENRDVVVPDRPLTCRCDSVMVGGRAASESSRARPRTLFSHPARC